MLTLVKTQQDTVKISESAQKLIAERIDPKATLFEDRGHYFIGVDQKPGQLVLGHGGTIAEAVQHAIDTQADSIYAPGQERRLGKAA